MDVGAVYVIVQRHNPYLLPSYNEVVGAEWHGPPIAVIAERVVADVPHWAKIDDTLMQIGQYVVQRTDEYDVAVGGYYWKKVGEGDLYMLRWRICEAVSRFARKIGLTIAIWRGR
jgi:hypothetical protein